MHSRMRIGWVGWNVRSGWGELARQVIKYLPITHWLIRPHGHYTMQPLNPNVESTICPTGIKLERFLNSVDVVLFPEVPLYQGLIGLAKHLNKPTICIPMQEWMPENGVGWPEQVDLFLCPTAHCYEDFHKILPCIYFPWPTSPECFTNRARTRCNKFLFINGHGGWNGRKGSDVLIKAIQLWPELKDNLIIYTQLAEQWPDGCDIRGEAPDNSKLYNEADVLICPHTVDGIGLEPREAMCAGMPVITTDGAPWKEIPALDRIPCTIERRRVKRMVDWHLPDPKALVSICQNSLGADISTSSKEALQWSTANSWYPGPHGNVERLLYHMEETVNGKK